MERRLLQYYSYREYFILYRIMADISLDLQNNAFILKFSELWVPIFRAK